MKKFLTVLLVIAVMFTFSFSAAFAATAEEEIDAAAVTAQKNVNKAVDDVLATAVYNQNGYLFNINSTAATADQALVNKDALVKGAEAEKAAQAELIANVVREQKLAGTYTATGFDPWATSTYDAAKALANVFNTTAYVEMFAVEKAAALEKANKVNPDEYVAFDYTEDNTANSDKDLALAAVNAAVTAINAVTAPKTTDTLTAVKSAVTSVKAVAVDLSALTYGKLADEEKALADAKTAANTAIAEASKTRADALKATYTSLVSTATTPSAKAAAQAKLDAVDVNVATVANVYLTKIANAAIDKDTNPTAAGTAVSTAKSDALTALASESAMQVVLDKLGNVDALINYANTVAAAKKTELATDGTIKYDSAVVDKTLAATVEKIKATTITTMADVDGEFTAMTTIAGTAAALTSYKTTKKTAVDAIVETGYNADETAQIKALKKAAKEDIDAAATTDAIDAIMTALTAAVAEVPTTAQITTLTTAANTAIGTLGYDAALDRLYDATEYAAPAGTFPTGAKTKVVDAAKKVMVDAVLAAINPAKAYATKDVEDIVKANYDAAKAVITGMASTDSLKAQVAAVVALIDAIPSTVTLGDADKVAAASDAYDALLKVPNYVSLAAADKIATAKENNLNSAKAMIKKLEGDVVKAAVKALNDKLTKLTAADEAEYLAAKDADAAYDKKYGTVDGLGQATTLAAIKAKIDDAKFADAAKALGAVPTEITKENAEAAKAAVEAAKAAYEALNDTQKGNIAKSLKDNLAKAEAALETLEDKEATAEKAANDSYVKGVCENVTIKFNGKKLSSGKTAFYFGDKGTAKLQKFEELGYVLEFKYYKAESKTKPTAPKCNIYMSTSKGKKTADNGYQMVPTKGTKGMFYAYAAEINVYDAEDNLVATIDKSQVNFGWAKWTGKTIK